MTYLVMNMRALNHTFFAEFTNVIHVASDTDEMKLLSSLHTLGYIEFDVLCNLRNLKEKLFMCAD